MPSLAQGLTSCWSRSFSQSSCDIHNLRELRRSTSSGTPRLRIESRCTSQRSSRTVIEGVPAEDRRVEGVKLARLLIELMAQHVGDEQLSALQLADPATVLRAIRRTLPDGQPQEIPRPLIPLLDTTLLTNAPGEPRVGHQIQAEIALADRIDLVMAFIRRTGIDPCSWMHSSDTSTTANPFAF